MPSILPPVRSALRSLARGCALTAFAATAAAALVLPVHAGATPISRVDDARLTSSKLTVRFQDGVVCRAAIEPDGGMGMFVSCPHKVRFDVKINRPNWFGPVLGDIVAPYGSVRIIAEDGNAQTFLSPRSREADYRREVLKE